MKKIMLAVGDKNLTAILKRNLTSLNNELSVIPNEVYHIRHLKEMIEQYEPEVIILHDYYLCSDIKDLSDREKEWLKTIHYIRRVYEDQVRVVFICERDKNDPFLSHLVNLNVLDIFYKDLHIEAFLHQIVDKPKYSSVAHLHTKQTLELDVSFEDKQIVESESDDNSFKELSEIVKTQFEKEYKQFEKDKEDAEKEIERLKNQLTDASKEKKELLEEQIKEKEELVLEKKRIVAERKELEKQRQKMVGERKALEKREITQRFKKTEEVVGVQVESKIIIVGAMFERIGATFFAHQLATLLAEYDVSVSYFENPYSYAYTYDRYYGAKKAPDYVSDYARLLPLQDELSNNSTTWEMGHVSWIVKNPLYEQIYDQNVVTFEKFVKVLLGSKSTYRIIDVGSNWTNSIVQELVEIADYSFIVTDTDIVTAQVYEEGQLDTLLPLKKWTNEEKLRFVINRAPSNLKMKEYTLIYHEFLTLPLFNQEVIHTSQLQGDLLISHQDLKEDLQNAFHPILNMVLPDKLLQKKKRHQGWIGKLLGKAR